MEVDPNLAIVIEHDSSVKRWRARFQGIDVEGKRPHDALDALIAELVKQATDDYLAEKAMGRNAG